MRAELCVRTLDSAAVSYPALRGAVVHSDRGSQYTSGLFCQTGKKTFQQVIRLSGLPVRPSDAIGPASRMVDQADFFHYPVDRPLAGDVHALRLLLS